MKHCKPVTRIPGKAQATPVSLATILTLVTGVLSAVATFLIAKEGSG